MSKDDYARFYLYAPTKLVLAVALAFGGGIGYRSFSGNDDSGGKDQRLDVCLYQLADIRSIANQHERDISALNQWATETLATIGSIQRLEALRSAPAAYSFARGLEVSR